MIVGKFIEECSNRFLCLVELEGIVTECYVSSSSKLENYIDLKNKKVMLVENKGKKLRTKYTLQAAWINRRWVLLNLNCINDLIMEYLLKQKLCDKDCILREHFVNEYKTDFFLPTLNMLMEGKGILSKSSQVIYPLVSCGRSIRQLQAIKNELQKGHKVRYIFVLMNPKITEIQLNSKESLFSKLFYECLAEGMDIQFYSVRQYNGKFYLKNKANSEVSIT